MKASRIKSCAPKARRDFIEAVMRRAAKIAITEKVIAPVEEKGELILIKGRGVSEEDRGVAPQAHGDPEAPGLSLGQWQEFTVLWF
jgi:hypothetical protein